MIIDTVIIIIVGKAVIRNTYQSLIYVALCSEKYVEFLIVCCQLLAPDKLHIDEVIREIIEDGRESFRNLDKKTKTEDTSKSLASEILFYWQIMMALMLLSFFVSCIAAFAQHFQMKIDVEESNQLRAKLPKNVRIGIK